MLLGAGLLRGRRPLLHHLLLPHVHISRRVKVGPVAVACAWRFQLGCDGRPGLLQFEQGCIGCVSMMAGCVAIEPAP